MFKSKSKPAFDPMAAVDQAKQWALVMNAAKLQLVELGWNDDMAERMVFVMYQQSH